MDQFVSKPIKLPPSAATGRYRRADLVFYGVEHRGSSYTARVFLDAANATPDTSAGRQNGYAGQFVIFGHGGCVGDSGHCDESEHRDAFDTGPPRGLRPQTKRVDVTSALKELGGDSVIVTVLPIAPSKDGAVLADNLRFTGLRLLTYELNAS